MKFKFTFLLLIVPLALALNASRAQNPIVVVQAASPAPVVATSVTTSPAAPDAAPAMIKLLEAMKATNAETLKKQEAVLQQLDELAKAAEQMKAFSKRS
jgi:hypothetical protein